MKGLIKLFSAVAFVGALASCSDDLSLSKANLDPNADLYATLPTEETTRMGVLEYGKVVWSEGDIINVYSANALKFNIYGLTSGAGESYASFDVITDNGVADKGELVAVSSSQYLKGVHATEGGQMQLIAKIPANFTQNEEVGDDQETVYWPLAIPYWANNVSFTGSQLNANMKALTGLLKINIKDLPAGTTAIVLNTHHFAYTSELDYAAKTNMLGGSDEALSGTLTTILKDGAALEVDEDYRHADTLRVDIDKLLDKNSDDSKTIFIPVIAGHYDKLSVLAISEDSKYDYVWPNAEVLRVFEDLDVTTQWFGQIAQSVTYECAFDDATDLSQFIAEKILNDGTWTSDGRRINGHTIKVKNLLPITSGTLYIANNIPGQSSVDIELAQSDVDFDILEARANYNDVMSEWITLSGSTQWLKIPVKGSRGYNDETSQDKARTVTITFADGTQGEHYIILPTSNVILKTDGVVTGKNIILSANTRQVSGYTDYFVWSNYRNYRNAGIVLRGSWGRVDIHQNQFGHVYANGDGVDDEINLLYFLGEFDRIDQSSTNYEGTPLMQGHDTNIDLRVTDMLIKKIRYYRIGENGLTNVYTTGNSGIKEIVEDNPNLDNRISVHASWTGQKLSDFALANGYDQSEIFTAAQVSSMGLASKTTLGVSPYDYFMSAYVRSVWLGGQLFPWIGADVTDPNDNSIAEAFSFDGKNTNFRNMYFSLYEPALPVECCCDGPQKIAIDEGLGLIRRIDTQSTVDIKNVDLTDALMDAHKFYIPNIGSICGRVSADDAITLKDNRADCIRVDANGRNIGGAFGWLNSLTSVTITNLAVKENSSIYGQTWVASKDVNVGGAIGLISADPLIPSSTAMYNTGVEEWGIDWNYCPIVTATGVDVYGEYVTSESDNVGGQVGYVCATTLTWGNDGLGSMKTHMNDQIFTIGSNVGGLIGHAWYQDKATRVRGTVAVKNQIYAQFDESRKKVNGSNNSGKNVGGLVGRMWIYKALNTQDNTTVVEGDVRVDGQVVAENKNAGGFVGYYQANKLQTGVSGNGNKVAIKALLEATEGYTGGLYGMLATAKEAQIGKSSGGGSITVEIGEIAGAAAVGGLIGSNANGSSTDANDKQLQILSAKGANPYPIKITIPKWTNTKTSNPWWYSNTGQAKLAGSFGTIDGYMDNVIKIVDNNITVAASDGILKIFERKDSEFWGPGNFKSNNPIFTDLKKIDLLFVLQGVSQSTEVEQALTGQGYYFWGDENGYVGVVANSGAGGGAYILDGNILKGDTNYNLYYDWSTIIQPQVNW